jgi:hypothetical protein
MSDRDVTIPRTLAQSAVEALELVYSVIFDKTESADDRFAREHYREAAQDLRRILGQA